MSSNLHFNLSESWQIAILYYRNVCYGSSLTGRFGSVIQTHKKGKIGMIVFCIIHLILPKPLQYLLNQILQKRWPVILAIVVRRHTSLHYKIINIVVSSPYSVICYNFYYITSVMFLICITMCSYVNTGHSE